MNPDVQISTFPRQPPLISPSTLFTGSHGFIFFLHQHEFSEGEISMDKRGDGMNFSIISF
jgi:hypothetical protein